MLDDTFNLLTRRRVDFGALLEGITRGDVARRGGAGFYKIGGTETAFEVYRWMTSSVTGKNFERWSWPTRWVRESLAMNMSSRVNCGSDGHITPFRSAYDRHQDSRPPHGWRDELASRFTHALLDGGRMAEWREAMGISLSKPRSVPLNVYDRPPPPPRSTHCGHWRPSWGARDEGNGFAGEVDRLFALAHPSRRLREQLNPYHPDARYLTAVMLKPCADGWSAYIEYGFDGSRWTGDGRLGWSKRDHAKDKTHCHQKPGEPFCHFIYRAHDQFDALLTPRCVARKACRRSNGFDGAAPSHNNPPAWDNDYSGDGCEAGYY